MGLFFSFLVYNSLFLSFIFLLAHLEVFVNLGLVLGLEEMIGIGTDKLELVYVFVCLWHVCWG